MGVFEAVKKGFSVAMKNLGLVLILIVFNLIWNLASIPLTRQGVTIAKGAAPTPQLTLAALLFSMLFVLVSIFVQGGALGLVRDYIKAGKMNLGGFASYGLKYYLRFLGLGLIIILIIGIVALIAALIIAATAPLNNTVVTVIATIIAIIIGAVGLYCVLLLIMSPYSLVGDELGIIGSMKKSIEVVRKAVGRVLLLLVLLILISLGIGFLIGFLTGLITVAMPVGAGQVVIGVVNSIFSGYLGIVMMAAFMAFYLALTGKEKPAA